MLLVFIDIHITSNSFHRARLSMRPSMWRLRQNILRKWRNGSWMMQQENAPAHTTLQTREFLGQTNTIVA